MTMAAAFRSPLSIIGFRSNFQKRANCTSPEVAATTRPVTGQRGVVRSPEFGCVIFSFFPTSCYRSIDPLEATSMVLFSGDLELKGWPMRLLPVIAYAFLLGLFGMVTDALPGVRADDSNKIRTIVRRGERVALEGFLLKGKYTLFEFYADWSPAWKKMAPEVEAKIKSGDDVVLRRINVRSWNSPVVSQHRITAIPHYKLYDPAGKLMKEYSPVGATTAGPGSRKSDRSSSRKSPKGYAPKVLNISPNGARVDLKKHLAKGKYTLFEFYANW